jgi:hypothetical protein
VGRFGLNSYCRTCSTILHRQYLSDPSKKAIRIAWLEKNKEHVKHKRWSAMLRRVHGISEDIYERMLKSQGGCCAICGLLGPARRGQDRLHVDHTHDKYKKIRGLLCSNCNTAIGLMKDDQKRLVRAAAYLRQPSLFAALRKESQHN